MSIPDHARANFQTLLRAASSGDLATRWIIAAGEKSVGDALALAGAVMRARWAEERDIADPATLADIATALGQDAAALAARADSPAVAALYEASTAVVIALSVAPQLIESIHDHVQGRCI